MKLLSKLLLLGCVMLSASFTFPENERQYEEMLLRIMDEDIVEKKSDLLINEIQANGENKQEISEAKTLVFINPHDRVKRQDNEAGSGVECPEIECKSSPSYICKPPTAENDCLCVCVCAPGYYNPNADESAPVSCVKGKFFGGEITYIEEYINNTENNKAIKDATESIFAKTEGFVSIKVLSITSGSTVVKYELTYENLATVNDSTVQSALDCGVSDTTAVASSLTLNVSSSCDTVIDPSVSCTGNGAFSDYCDATSTKCSVNFYGYAVCSCTTSNTYNLNDTVCVDQICLSNADCNGPFGWCNTELDIRTCTCMWGFTGINCAEPWQFVLTVVAAGCGLIIIILIGVSCYCSRRTQNTKGKKNSKKLTETGEIDLQNPFTSFQPGMMRAWLPEGKSNIEDMQMTSINNGRPSTTPSVQRHNSNEVSQTNGHTNHGFEGASHQREHSSSTFSPVNPNQRSTKENKALDYF